MKKNRSGTVFAHQIKKGLTFSFLLQVLLCQNIFSQTTTPQEQRGKILSDTQEPIPGATIRTSKGTGTITDKNGEFIIKATNTDSLTVEFLGFKTKRVAIQNGIYLIVALNPSSAVLNDVVVVGYGTQKRSGITGAISVVKSEALINRPVTNALGALQGTAPGLVITRSTGQPGKEGWSAQIRNFTSVNGSSPLILVDGVEQANIGAINQNDIASVSILKDAATAAIYGARAAGGVILITTKRGKEGKLTVAYDGMYTVNRAYSMPQRIDSWREAEMLNESRINAGQGATWTEQQIAWFKDPNFNYRVNPANPSNYEYYDNVNMIDSVARKTTQQQQHNISVSGGNNNTQYLFSAGYYS